MYIELTLRIHVHVSEQARGGTGLNEGRAHEDATVPHSKYDGDFDEDAGLAQKFGGGTEGQLVKDLAQVTRGCAPAWRSAGGRIPDALIERGFAPQEMLPR